jgi:Predicted ATPases
MSTLQDVTIKRFKSITEVNLKNLAQKNIFVGGNNSGKSSVLQAIHFAVSICQSLELLNERTGTISAQQILYTPLHEVHSLKNGGQLTQTESQAMVFNFKLQSGFQGEISIRRGKNKNLATSVVGDELFNTLKEVSSPFSVYVPGLAGIARNEQYLSEGLLVRAVARGDANLVLRNVLYQLWLKREENTNWKDFLVSLKKVFGDVDLDVKFEAKLSEYIQVDFQFKGHTIPIDAAGTGALQTIQILSYIYFFNPKVLLLDEPDSHLHPNNQKALANVLSEICHSRSIQLLLATHSKHLLEALSEDAQIIWMKNGKEQKFEEFAEILLDLGAFDSAELLINKAVKYVFLTEDSDPRKLQKLLESFLKPEQLMIWPYKGCTNVLSATLLGKFIKAVSPETQIFIHRDSDYLEEDFKEHIANMFSKYNIHSFFTDGLDIEAHFCDLEHLKHLNPEHADLIEPLIMKIIESNSVTFKESAENGKINAREVRHKNGLNAPSMDECKKWARELDISIPSNYRGKKFIKLLSHEFKTASGKNLVYVSTTKYIVPSKLKDKIDSL